MNSVDGVGDQEDGCSKEANSKITPSNIFDNLLPDGSDHTTLVKRAGLKDPLVQINMESDRNSRSKEIDTINRVCTSPTLHPPDNLTIYVKFWDSGGIWMASNSQSVIIDLRKRVYDELRIPLCNWRLTSYGGKLFLDSRTLAYYDV